MIRFLTSGESHGIAETAILEGIPAGLSLSVEIVQKDLDKRRGGAGRGGRGILEKDQVRILSGVRHGKTLGSPIALIVENLDFANWSEKMQIEPLPYGVQIPEDTNPRPGHTDLSGVLKYGFTDIRNVLERASARETIMRVAIGAICRIFLQEFDIRITSRIIQVGRVQWFKSIDYKKLEEIIMEARKKKDTLGGVIEISAQNVPPGLGSYVHWDRKIDGLIAQSLMSIHSVKAVEIGNGVKIAQMYGSKVHDSISYDGKFRRNTNNAGGIEGGVTNGEEIVCRVYHKPISTLGNPLNTVDINTKKPVKALIERSDICVVPRAGVISESMVAFILANAVIEKFGSDSMQDIINNYQNYLDRINKQ